jgi:hypothetical protein
MSGSPMNSSDPDGMGAKGWVSILGEQDLNITEDWWISDIGAGEEIGFCSAPGKSYDPSGTHRCRSQDYKYYEPNGNYVKDAWLNFVHDEEGWVYHNDDNNAFYAYYDYMCMSETNYIKAERYVLLPGFFNAIERATREGNTVVDSTTQENFYDDKLTTELVKDNIELDIILYDFNTSGNHVTIDRTKLSNDLNKSVGVFLAKHNDANGQLKLIKYLGTYKDFDGGKGRLQLDDFSSDYAYKDTFIHFYYCNPADMDWTECWDYNTNNTVVTQRNNYAGQSDSYDRFSIRPDRFTITSTIGAKIKAGDEFNLTIQALDINGTPALNYNESVSVSASPLLDHNITLPGCDNGTLSIVSDANFTNGEANITLVYDEVGDVDITLHEIASSDFAHVDFNDTDFNSNTDDSPQTDNDTYREIEPATIQVSFIPDHFDVDAVLKDYHHSSSTNFTYISSNPAMSANIDVDVIAKNKDGDTVNNYISTCYAKPIDINLTFKYNTYDNNTVPSRLNQMICLIEDREDSTRYSGDNRSEIEDKKITQTITKDVFPAGDHNSTAYLDVKIGFDRNYYTPINPFELNSSISVTDTDGVTGTTANDTENAHYLYARAKSTKYFYDDITTASAQTPIKVEVYCDKWPASVNCPSVDVLYGATNDAKWYISTSHDSNNGDGNISLKTDVGNVTNLVNNINNGIDSTVTVQPADGTRPAVVNIELKDSGTGTVTDTWLIYNKDLTAGALPVPPNPFYKVRFIGNATWSGVGKTGKVVDTNASSKKTKRMDW